MNKIDAAGRLVQWARAWPIWHRISTSSSNQSLGTYWFYCRIHLSSRRRIALKEDMDGLDRWVCHQEGQRSRCSPHNSWRRNSKVHSQIAIPNNQQWNRVWSNFNRIESCKSPQSQEAHHPSWFLACNWPSERRLRSEGRKDVEVSKDYPTTSAVLQQCRLPANPPSKKYRSWFPSTISFVRWP